MVIDIVPTVANQRGARAARQRQSITMPAMPVTQAGSEAMSCGFIPAMPPSATLAANPSQTRANQTMLIRVTSGPCLSTDAARSGLAQIAFLLKATSVKQVAETSFGGGVMPQKSTDFYPKLLSGLTIYKLDS